MENNNRVLYYDGLKIIAIYFVIFYHSNLLSTNIIENGSPTVYFNYFTKSLLSSCVPIFFLVNGALLLNKTFCLSKHIKKIIKIASTTIIWAIVTILLLSFVRKTNLSLYDFVDILSTWKIGWNNHLWFLNALVVIYIFFPLIKLSYDYKKSYFNFFFIIIMISTFGIKLITILGDIYLYTTGKNYVKYILDFTSPFNPVRGIYGYSLGYFMLGGILADNIQSFRLLTKFKCVFAIILSMVLLTLYGVMKTNLDSNQYDIVWYGYDTVFTLVITVSLFLLLSHISTPKKIQKLIILIGQNTLGIYLLHPFFISIMKPHFVRFFNTQDLIQVQIFTILILLISLTLCLILQRIPIVKNMFISS